MKKIHFISFLLAIMMLGCLEIRQEVRIESSLKGELIFSLVYDINDDMIKIARMMEQEKIEQESKRVGIQVKSEFTDDGLRDKICSLIKDQNNAGAQNMSFDNIPGIKLKEYRVYTDDKQHPYINMIIAFDNILNLQKLGNQLQGFSVKGKGNHIILEQNVDMDKMLGSQMAEMPLNMNPKGANPRDREMQMMLKALFKNIKAKFRVRVPYKKYDVVKHTAHRIDDKNHTYYWEYDNKTKKNKVKQSLYIELAPKKDIKTKSKNPPSSPKNSKTKGKINSPKH